MSNTFLVLRTQQGFVCLLKCKLSGDSVLISRCLLRKFVIASEETSGKCLLFILNGSRIVIVSLCTLYGDQREVCFRYTVNGIDCLILPYMST